MQCRETKTSSVKMKIPMPFETQFERYVDKSKLSAPDFMVRLETLLTVASAKKVRLSAVIGDWWRKFFPEVPFCEAIGANAVEYMERDRIGMKLTSRNEYIRSDKTRLITLVPLAALLGIAENGVADERLAAYIRAALKGVKDDCRIVPTGTGAVLRQLACPKWERTSFQSLTLKILNENRSTIKELLDALKKPLLFSPVAGRKSPLEFARIVCLVEECLQEGASSQEKRQLIRKHWPVAFGGTPCKEEELEEFLRYMEENPFLSALSFLFRMPIEKVIADKIIRMIAVARAVNAALALSPSTLSHAELVESAAGIYRTFNVMSIGMEEEDIAQYTGYFLNADSRIDERVIPVFREHKDAIKSNYDNTKEGLNKSSRRNYYIEKIQSQNDRQVASLQEQVRESQFAVLYRLTEKLSCSTYGYLLGKMYRIAYGYDTPDSETVADLCRDVLQILQMFAIVPTSEELIGVPYSEIDEENCKVILDPFAGHGDSGVIYPGWRVEEDIVALPVATEDE